MTTNSEIRRSPRAAPSPGGLARAEIPPTAPRTPVAGANPVAAPADPSPAGEGQSRTTDGFAAGQVTGTSGVSSAKSTEALRQEVARAVGRINLRLYENLKGASANPVWAGVLTATQLAQIMPAMTKSQQEATLSELGLSNLSAEEFIRGTRAFEAQFGAGLPDDVTLRQASYAYVQKGRDLNPAIAAGPVQQVDFHEDPDAAAATVNGDIKAATDGMIEKLVEPGAIEGKDVLLAAAVFVEAPWGNGVRFNPDDTGFKSFRAERGGAEETVSVETMRSRPGQFRVLDGDGFQALALPNGSSGGLATLYIKPNEGSLDDFLHSRGADGLQAIIADVLNPVGATPAEGEVRIPVTEFEFRPDGDAFLEALRDVGLPRTAQLLADAPVDIDGAAYMGKAVTNEKGIRMAAAQAIFGLESAIMPSPPAPVVFDGNRSMLQVVVKDGQMLFFNPIKDPSASA